MTGIQTRSTDYCVQQPTCPPTTMTFAVLRALHTIVGDALSEIEHVYADVAGPYASPPPSPTSPAPTSTVPDFPALDAPSDPSSLSEQLTAHPTVAAAITRIVAAAGQLSATVHPPFLTICDAAMGYHLPSCLRLLEAAHIPEMLREGPLHVRELANKTGVEQAKLAHILRLLATHHFLREVAPDVFATNRISSLLDSGKPVASLQANPERKYDGDASAVAAFVGLCTDELHKSSAYITEAVFPDAAKIYPELERSLTARSPISTTATTTTLPAHSDPTRSPFNHAFGCAGVGYFAWLEGEGCTAQEDDPKQDEPPPPAPKKSHRRLRSFGGSTSSSEKTPPPPKPGSSHSVVLTSPKVNPNQFRLERFGKAMAGTGSWEAPGAVLAGFDWASLPPGSTIVDVGGGIGSTTMVLASEYAGEAGSEGRLRHRACCMLLMRSAGLRFVVQDRAVVVEMGEKAWRAKCPELLDSGAVRFQVHDFFTPQPILKAAVYFLRVVLHDWPDAFAQKILLRLREAASSDTRLVIGDWVLPMACVDDFGDVEGAEKMLAPAPLLPNLGKASANVYWMDMTMHAAFNAQERTLREIVALAASAGWKVIKVTKAPGSLFGHIVAVPVPVPISAARRSRGRAGSGSAFAEAEAAEESKKNTESGNGEGLDNVVERASSRCGTPTFGSRVELPSRGPAKLRKPFGYGAPTAATVLKQAAPIMRAVKRNKPSPLTATTTSTMPASPLPSPLPSNNSSLRSILVSSPRPPPPTSPVVTLVRGRVDSGSQNQAQRPLARSRTPFRPPGPGYAQSSTSPGQSPIPGSPRPTLGRRSSHAQLSPSSANNAVKAGLLRHMPSSPVLKQSSSRTSNKPYPGPPSPVPVQVPSRIPALLRRASAAQLHPPPPLPSTPKQQQNTLLSPLGSIRRMGSMLLPARTVDFGRSLNLNRRKGMESDDIDAYEMSDDDVGVSVGAGEGVRRPMSPGLLPAGSVLAEAAKIERGAFRRGSPDD
ncbi:Ich1 protein [Mycena chlorophos]|uniref:Ich1 protein n=1 Tax=Mycena chlorophos TaxID=658473 RepID=A0A8H6W9P2_MYCCL|nr:Ich1 protein [Mycena chlorophos]